MTNYTAIALAFLWIVVLVSAGVYIVINSERISSGDITFLVPLVLFFGIPSGITIAIAFLEGQKSGI